jgi:hypothetical protein
MKKDDVKIGGTYMAKVSDKVVAVRIDAANARGGWDATNLSTNKQVRIKSAQRLRGPAPQREEGQRGRAVAETQAADAATTVPVTPAKRARKAGDPGAKKSSGLSAAHQVLTDAGEPMRCADMVEKMLSTGLWKTNGKTPAATIYAAIVREISTKGTASRFRKTDRGLFTVAAN